MSQQRAVRLTDHEGTTELSKRLLMKSLSWPRLWQSCKLSSIEAWFRTQNIRRPFIDRFPFMYCMRALEFRTTPYFALIRWVRLYSDKLLSTCWRHVFRDKLHSTCWQHVLSPRCRQGYGTAPTTNPTGSLTGWSALVSQCISRLTMTSWTSVGIFM